jgi:hypothetical protein
MISADGINTSLRELEIRFFLNLLKKKIMKQKFSSHPLPHFSIDLPIS